MGLKLAHFLSETHSEYDATNSYELADSYEFKAYSGDRLNSVFYRDVGVIRTIGITRTIEVIRTGSFDDFHRPDYPNTPVSSGSRNGYVTAIWPL